MIITKKQAKVYKIILGIFLLLAAVFTLLPIVWMLLSSVKSQTELMQFPPTILPKNITFENFVQLFTQMNFVQYLLNTLIVVFWSFFGMFLSAGAGYAFAKFNFKGRRFLFYLVLATMMIPGQVTMIPVYLLLNAIGLTNTMTGVVLPGLVGAFSIFLFRQFMSGISTEMLEAARLEGASEWTIFWRIIIPVSKPILAVQGILTFIAGWNSFLWPLIIANDQNKYTLSVGLQLLKGQYTANYGLQMAGSAFMVIPIIIVYMIFQKYFLEGFNVSGMK
ncbi:carbohydrate ABC transporter permease [Lactococcus allomyrinae]|uniref:Carbohydrate ABC transporter permease n=1 Tax=Lactococcus allomyrinae TaxID=2419773 RepID=A0A387BEZ0_9LACT|nr:carbohydrate ABC transporter permease [Lactococcus allomyrinae]AYG00642.1 carbohydrate ABC transporter permease [Lactococcus allomyrinae]